MSFRLTFGGGQSAAVLGSPVCAHLAAEQLGLGGHFVHWRDREQLGCELRQTAEPEGVPPDGEAEKLLGY